LRRDWRWTITSTPVDLQPSRPHHINPPPPPLRRQRASSASVARRRCRFRNVIIRINLFFFRSVSLSRFLFFILVIYIIIIYRRPQHTSDDMIRHCHCRRRRRRCVFMTWNVVVSAKRFTRRFRHKKKKEKRACIHLYIYIRRFNTVRHWHIYIGIPV